MTDTVIRVQNLSKQYKIVARSRHETLRDRIMGTASSLFRRGGDSEDHPSTVWALRDVSFQIQRGEAVGIIGRNGAGKSTLLKVLSRITQPTAGFADIYGRVGSLLEVGTGFHPELTGRDNVYLNGAILGMKKADIERQFDEIVDFSGVEKFIDTPVKRYSSGMQLRLAFAVAAHLEAEILIIDEALAVGDAAFQKKCLGKMGDVVKGGRTVLLVTHNLGLISTLADRALLLEQGEVKYFGEAALAISAYLGDETTKSSVDLREHPNRPVGMTSGLISARITDKSGQDRNTFTTGEEWILEIDYCCPGDVKLEGSGFNIRTRAGYRVGGLNTYMCSQPPFRIPTQGKIQFCIPKLQLNTGDYVVSVAIGTHPEQHYDQVNDALTFSVVQSDFYGTGYILTWDHGPSVFTGWYQVLARKSNGRI